MQYGNEMEKCREFAEEVEGGGGFSGRHGERSAAVAHRDAAAGGTSRGAGSGTAERAAK